MPNFEEIKRRAQGAAFAAAEKAQGAAAVAGEKAGAIKDAAKTNVSLVTERRNLEKSFQALGEWYAARCGEDAPEGAADIVKAIRASQEKLEALRELKDEQDASARELLDRGAEFFAQKAKALASFAKKPAGDTAGEEGHVP